MRTRPSTRRARTRARRRCARRCSPTSPRPSPSACCPCGTSTRSARIPRCAPGLQLARPTHALGKMIQAQRGRRPVPGHRDRLPDPGRVRPQGLHPRLGPGRGARGRADPVRCPARAGDRHQPGHRRGHHGPGTSRRVQPRDRPPDRRRARPDGGRVTSPAPTPAPTARSACWAGGRSTTSPRASAIRFNGPRSATRSYPARSWPLRGSVLRPANPAFRHLLPLLRLTRDARAEAEIAACGLTVVIERG